MNTSYQITKTMSVAMIVAAIILTLTSASSVCQAAPSGIVEAENERKLDVQATEEIKLARDEYKKWLNEEGKSQPFAEVPKTIAHRVVRASAYKNQPAAESAAGAMLVEANQIFAHKKVSINDDGSAQLNDVQAALRKLKGYEEMRENVFVKKEGKAVTTISLNYNGASDDGLMYIFKMQRRESDVDHILHWNYLAGATFTHQQPSNDVVDTLHQEVFGKSNMGDDGHHQVISGAEKNDHPNDSYEIVGKDGGLMKTQEHGGHGLWGFLHAIAPNKPKVELKYRDSSYYARPTVYNVRHLRTAPAL